jgi:hypothetical protein
LAALTKEVLEEVPEQFISYCKSRNVQPMKKNAIVDSDFERKKRNHNYNFAPAVPEEKNASPSPPNYQTITELFPPSAIPTVANPQLNASKKPTPPQLQRAGTVRECVVCLEAMADQIILPCMHMVLCSVSLFNAKFLNSSFSIRIAHLRFTKQANVQLAEAKLNQSSKCFEYFIFLSSR